MHSYGCLHTINSSLIHRLWHGLLPFLHLAQFLAHCLEQTAFTEWMTATILASVYLLYFHIISCLIDLSPKAYNEYKIIHFLMGFCMVLSLQYLSSSKTSMNRSSQHPFEVRIFFTIILHKGNGIFKIKTKTFRSFS